MIRITSEVVKKQRNFWNGCVFHPTDAVEDPWGKRILDRMSEDGSMRAVRIYAMLEDVVYTDETGKLCYDFRLSDLRLDYMVEKGYRFILAYAGMPDCIAADTAYKTSVSKNKTRYKGKLWNSAPPRDFALWEEICYEYTRHNVERYGIEVVSTWLCQCFNEPDISAFFHSELPKPEWEIRLRDYCKLYEAFERGIRRVSDRVRIGGPVLAYKLPFLEGFLSFVKEKNLKLDYIALHGYGTSPRLINQEGKHICTENLVDKIRTYRDVIFACGFGDTPIVVDEWGMASAGFFNREECPELMARETEVFSSYYVKLIQKLVYSDVVIDELMICLSGQHEMVEDFSGFRNFFTLNFIKKPIYNAFLLAARLKENVLAVEGERENLFVLPTKDDKGNHMIALTYSDPLFSQNVPTVTETFAFDESLKGKTLTLYCIDAETTNPYRLYLRNGMQEPISPEEIALLREEGCLKPVLKQELTDTNLSLQLTPNSTYFIMLNEGEEL
ncbi:MAG: hypothetical protein IKC69_04475 [Clostridia bacterium]|nr:hypothetical protein [Clostridia bacterium]